MSSMQKYLRIESVDLEPIDVVRSDLPRHHPNPLNVNNVEPYLQIGTSTKRVKYDMHEKRFYPRNFPVD